MFITVLALLVVGGLIISNAVEQQATNTLQNKIDISVYFKTTTSEDDILNVQNQLEGLAEVQSVQYISQTQALSVFESQHQNDQTITQAIQQLGTNPLEASLNVKAKDPSNYSQIASYLENPALSSMIDNVSYQQNQVVIDRLAKIVNYMRWGGLALTIIFALLAVLVAFNTILLAIYSNREEIEVMRLVGASNTFIRGPFIVEGVIYGVIAAVLSIVIIAPITYFLSPYMAVVIPSMNLFGYLTSNLIAIFIYELLAGIAIGVVSGMIAIWRYLKV